MTDPAAFSRFAETAEAIAATTRRNEKADRLGAYFAALPDDALRLAARYFAARLFPLHDQRTAGLGPAALLTALAARTGEEKDALRRHLVRLGDLGDVAGEVIEDDEPSGRTLHDAAEAFAALASMRGTRKKTESVAALLAPPSAREAKYLIKLLQGDLRIGLKEGGVEAALARLHGVKVGDVQRANMLTGDLGETALLARHGRLDAARMDLFHPIKFMLASPAEDAADVVRQMPARFAVEDKFDGIRAQAHVAPDPGEEGMHGAVHEGARVALFSRTLDALTPAFPDLVAPLAALLAPLPPGAGLILDGEIVPVEDAQILPFQKLQPRLGRKNVTEAMQQAAPVAFVLFDLLFYGEEVLLDVPYEKRRTLLEKLGLDEVNIRRSDVAWMDEAADVDTHIDAAFDAARARGNEGLMVKNPGAPYKPGRRGRDWLKVKKALATLDVVVTSVEVGSGRRNKFLSDFTFAVRRSESDPTLLNVGKAYSGLTDVELAELTAWFKAHTTQQFAHGRVRLVEPEIVIEVAFDRVQPSPRHKSGYALRFPRIVRLRPDKPVEEIDTLETVRHLAEG